LTNDKHKAQDLYQETAFTAYKNKDKFQEGTNIKSWLLTIMRNTFINDYRKKKRQRLDFLPLMPNDIPNNHTFNSAEDRIAEQEILAIIDNNLKDNLKEPFLMAHAGYKYKEIAAEMYLPEGTVKSRVFMARERLRNVVRQN
jgi:RNA polymerase sigma-70 factor (ECF subfamily)